MSDFSELAGRLVSALERRIPPVTVTFRDKSPAGVTAPASTAAAGCKFWEHGAASAVVTHASDHQFCSTGNTPSVEQSLAQLASP